MSVLWGAPWGEVVHALRHEQVLESRGLIDARTTDQD